MEWKRWPFGNWRLETQSGIHSRASGAVARGRLGDSPQLARLHSFKPMPRGTAAAVMLSRRPVLTQLSHSANRTQWRTLYG